MTHTNMVGWLQTVTYNQRNGCMGLYHYCTILYLYSCQIQSHVAFVFAFFLSSHIKSTFLDRNIPSHHRLFVAHTLPKSPLPERLARLLPNRLPGASKWGSIFPLFAFCSQHSNNLEFKWKEHTNIRDPPSHSLGGVGVPHFVVNQPLSLQNGSGTESPS